MCRNSPRRQNEQWGIPVAGAALHANAVEEDVVDSAIIIGASNSSTTDKEITAAITCRVDLRHLDATMGRATLVATTLVGVAVIASALVSFVAPPGIKPNSALRQANLSVSP